VDEDSPAADVTVDEGAPAEDEADPDSKVTDGAVVELTRVVGDETAAVVDDPVITALD
jgi:hypothetical protein